MLGTGGIGRDVRQIHFGLLAGGQLDFRFLGRFLQTLQRQRILVQVDAGVFLEFAGQILDQAQVEVFATQVGVTVGGQYFELVLAIHFGDFDDGNIEGAAAQVVHGDDGITALLVHAVGQGRSSGLVDDAFDVQTGDAACVLGGLALAVVEVGRHSDNRFGDGLAQIVLGGLLHFLQHFGGNLRRGHFLAAHFHPGVAIIGFRDFERHAGNIFLYFIVGELAADQALHRVQGVVRVGNRLAFGGLAHQYFAIFVKSDDGRRGAVAFAVFDDLGFVSFHDRHAGVGCAQVNTDNLAHVDLHLVQPAGGLLTRFESVESLVRTAGFKTPFRLKPLMGAGTWFSRPVFSRGAHFKRLSQEAALLTTTIAGRTSRPLRVYPFCSTIMTELGARSGLGTMLMA